jgi:hypothetical protein
MRLHYRKVNCSDIVHDILHEKDKRFTFVYSAIGIMMAGTIAGGGYAMSAQNTAGKTQNTLYQNQAAYRLQQAEQAKKAADRNITTTQMQASQEAKTLAAKAGAVEGTQKATLAASGVGSGSVTAEDVITDTFDRAKLDEIALRYNADSRSEEYENQGRNGIWTAQAEGVQLRAAGKNAVREAKVNQASTALSTATSVAGALTTAYGYGGKKK